jgi:hypothetical protein
MPGYTATAIMEGIYKLVHDKTGFYVFCTQAFLKGK